MKISVVFDVDKRTIIQQFDSFEGATQFYEELCERHGIEKVTLIGAGGGILREKGRLKE
jgi:predicted ATP-grasp superfamily ATP-dependent carboligase